MRTELNGCEPDIPGYVIRYALDGVQRGWLATEIETGDRCVVRCPTSPARTLADIGGELPHRILVRDIRRIAPSGDLLIVEELVEGRMLSEVLRDVSLSSGQVVTLLVPLLETCAALAEQSLAPVALEPTDVLIDTTGRARIANDVVLAATAASTAHVEHLAAIAVLLARLPDSVSAHGRGPGQLSLDLLAHCEPQPIEIDRVSDVRQSLPIRLNPFELQAELSGIAAAAPDNRGIQWLIQSARDVIRGRIARIVPIRRARTLGFSVALAAALVGVSLVAIPASHSDSAEGATDAVNSETAPPHEQSSDSPTPDTTPGDPASTVLTLVSLRATCAAAHESAECLNQVDEAGSPQFHEDDERLKLAQALRFADTSDASAELVSTMGKAALVRVRTANATASVLLVQTEAGWRIRELFD